MSLSRILKNTGFVLLPEQLSGVVNFFVVVYVVRYLGTAGYGLWSTILVMPAMLSVLLDLGMNSYLLREVAADPARRDGLVGRVLTVKAGLALIYVLVTVLTSGLLGHDTGGAPVVLVVAIATTLISFSEVFITVFRAFGIFSFDATFSVSRTILNACLTLAVVRMNLGIAGLAYVQMATGILLLALSLRCYLRAYPLSVHWAALGEYMQLIVKSLPFAIFVLVMPVFLQIDVLMLAWLRGSVSVAIYNAPYRIIMFLYVIPFALRKALFPELAGSSGGNGGDFSELFAKSLKISLLVALPLAAGLFLLADRIIPFLFPAEFASSAGPLRIMALMLLINFLNSVFNVALCSRGMEKRAVALLLMALAVNVALDLALIPGFDYLGAAMASLAAESALFAGYVLAVSRQLALPRRKLRLRWLLPTLVMSCSVLLTGALPVLVQVFVGMIVYAVLLFRMKVVTLAELTGSGSA